MVTDFVSSVSGQNLPFFSKDNPSPHYNDTSILHFEKEIYIHACIDIEDYQNTPLQRSLIKMESIKKLGTVL